MLTFSSKPAAFGVPVNTSPRLLEMPDSVVPPVASLVSRGGASTSRSVMPMNRPTCVESMMMRLSSLPTGSSASGPISQDVSPRSIECRVASSETLPDDGVIDAVRPDLHLVVVAARACVMNGKPRMPTDGSKLRFAALRTLLARRYSA